MEVQPDSSINVTESITADFTGDPHHGIYRDLPLSGKDKWGNNYRLRIDDVRVTDGSGNPLQTVTSPGLGRLQLKIGSPNTMLSTPQTYNINYHLQRAVHFFSEHDEIYWNVVGNEWENEIQNASCLIVLPKDAPVNQLRTQSYTGIYGTTTTGAISDTPNGRTARYWMTRPLSSGEGMTVVFGWPKGIVQQPSFKQEAIWFVSDNGYFFLPIFFLIGLVLYWRKIGADPDTGKSEVVAYDPPDNLNPAELGTLIDEKADMRDIAASIIDLAVRGFLHIKVTKEKAFFGSKTDYTLELNKSYDETIADPKLTDFEQSLIKGLFSGADHRVMSTLQNSFYIHMPNLKKSLYRSLIKRGYFTHSPEDVRKSYQGVGVFIIVAGVFLAVTSTRNFPLQMPVGWALAISVCGVMLAIAARTMPRKTAKGKDAFLGAKGFEEYLSRAERAEIEYQERNDIFEKFLPYAMALGIADKWASAFDGIQTAPPSWYSGYDDTFRPTIFVHDLNYATSSWGSTMASTPRSSGSGGSGFFSGGSGFSGGSSGGGGGGGGGGGW